MLQLQRPSSQYRWYFGGIVLFVLREPARAAQGQVSPLCKTTKKKRREQGGGTRDTRTRQCSTRSSADTRSYGSGPIASPVVDGLPAPRASSSTARHAEIRLEYDKREALQLPDNGQILRGQCGCEGYTLLH